MAKAIANAIVLTALIGFVSSENSSTVTKANLQFYESTPDVKFRQFLPGIIGTRPPTRNPLDDGDLRHHVFIMQLVPSNNEDKGQKFKAFCGGSLFAPAKVISSANCFYTDRKRLKRPLSKLKVIGGHNYTWKTIPHGATGLWKNIKKVFTQRYFRHPAYNLAVVMLTDKFIYDTLQLMAIPLATRNQEFDGNCISPIIKANNFSWTLNKTVHIVAVHMMGRKKCSEEFLRPSKQYYCSTCSHTPLYPYLAIEGAGLICHYTNDPVEKDNRQGILVGVTSFRHQTLPTLHTRVVPFRKWINSGSEKSVLCEFDIIIILFCVLAAVIMINFKW